VAVVPLSTSRLLTTVAPVELPSTEMPSRRLPYDVLLRYRTPVEDKVSKPWSPFP
jgi:hypothetical protein